VVNARRSRGEAQMTKFLAGVLSVIAVGVLLIAYGLLNPQAAVYGSGAMTPAMRQVPLGEPVAMRDPALAANPGYAPYGYVPAGYVPASAPAAYYAAQPAGVMTYAPAPAAYAQPVVMTASEQPRAVRAVSYAPAAPRTQTRYVERKPQRDWKKTAMIIGGSSAAGAGVGAIFGGKKGALIGAAIGGGASTIYETTKK
jgi:hypothetical protein